ncbi:MAG: BON domain-containing protein [Candidatus Korobacteraceae bacterium]
MKGHPAVIAFLLLAVGLAVAQVPAANTGVQSAASPSSGSATNNSKDNAAAPSVTEDQNDGAWQSRIENALRNEPTLRDSHIVVNVSTESIDLGGTVGSSKDRQTAERLAQSFDGNRKLNDNLMITGHGHSDLAPDHSAMNNGGTGNAQNPTASQGGTVSNNPPNPPPKR